MVVLAPKWNELLDVVVLERTLGRSGDVGREGAGEAGRVV